MTRKEFLIISIATLITVIAWVVFDILHARAQVQIQADVKEVIEPINPNFDVSGI